MFPSAQRFSLKIEDRFNQSIDLFASEQITSCPMAKLNSDITQRSRIGDLSISARLIKTVRRVANPFDSRSPQTTRNLLTHTHHPSRAETPFLPIYSGKSAKVCAMCYRRDPRIRIVVPSRTNKKVERRKARTPGPNGGCTILRGFIARFGARALAYFVPSSWRIDLQKLIRLLFTILSPITVIFFSRNILLE